MTRLSSFNGSKSLKRSIISQIKLAHGGKCRRLMFPTDDHIAHAVLEVVHNSGTNTDLDYDNDIDLPLVDYEDDIGIPAVVMGILSTILDTYDDFDKFVTFLESIPVGVNLSYIFPSMGIFLLKNQRSSKKVTELIYLYEELLRGDVINPDVFSAVQDGLPGTIKNYPLRMLATAGMFLSEYLYAIKHDFPKRYIPSRTYNMSMAAEFGSSAFSFLRKKPDKVRSMYADELLSLLKNPIIVNND